MSVQTDVAALRVLVEVAAAGSLSGAARRLGTSQQAVSARMRALESGLGLRLLSRSAQGTRLTESGAVVAGWASEVLEAATRFEASVAALSAPGAATVRVAASLTIAEHLLPRWLSAHRRARGADVELHAANSAAVIERVREGSADLGFIETPRIPADLVSAPLGVDELVVVVRPGHRWARRSSITRAQLAATPLAVREAGSGTREALDDALREGAEVPRAAPAAVLPTTAALRATALAGDDPAVLSILAVAEDLQARRLIRVRVRDVPLKRQLTILWRRDDPPTAPARHLLELIAAEAV